MVWTAISGATNVSSDNVCIVHMVLGTFGDFGAQPEYLYLYRYTYVPYMYRYGTGTVYYGSVPVVE